MENRTQTAIRTTMRTTKASTTRRFHPPASPGPASGFRTFCATIRFRTFCATIGGVRFASMATRSKEGRPGVWGTHAAETIVPSPPRDAQGRPKAILTRPPLGEGRMGCSVRSKRVPVPVRQCFVGLQDVPILSKRHDMETCSIPCASRRRRRRPFTPRGGRDAVSSPGWHLLRALVSKGALSQPSGPGQLYVVAGAEPQKRFGTCDGQSIAPWLLKDR